MRVLTSKLRVEIENETRVFLESLNFEIEMRVSQKSGENRESLHPACILRFDLDTIRLPPSSLMMLG